jgi:3'(2'), 5'-bisphosphate nucleotidase
MPPSGSPPQLVALGQIAAAAGALILRLKRQGLGFTAKADGSPVSEADRQAERHILSELARHWPNIPAFGEEMCAGTAAAVKPKRFFWIDPLDGTCDFAAGCDEYTVNIALIVNHRPVWAALHAPALGLTYIGDVEAGAWRSRHATGTVPATQDFTPIQARSLPPDGSVALISRSHLDEETKAYLKARPGYDALPLGSSLKFARLAEGEADLYPRLSSIMEWDIAAGDALLTAAGGSVRDLNGQPLQYGHPGTGYRALPFIAAGKRNTAE